jgi:hypothetical protein
MLWSALTVLFIVALAAAAFAEDPAAPTPTPEPAATPARLPFRLDFDFQTFTLLQNDRDFDRTKPLYNKYGQSIGYVSTVLIPGITWMPIDQIVVRYSPRIGDAVWSRNDAEQRAVAGDNGILIQTREMWGQVDLGSSLSLRTGYYQVFDPTHLFIERYIGAANVTYEAGGNRLTLMAGQLPDSVYETTAPSSPAGELEFNNFDNDRVLFGLDAAMLAGENWLVNPAMFALWDRTEIDRARTIVNTSMLIFARYTHWNLELDLAWQLGQHRSAGPNNRDVNLSAGAAQVRFHAFTGPWQFGTTLLGFTADNGNPNDQYDTGFTYSGKSGAETLMLTRNHLYDQYDSLDLRAATQGAGFLLADEEIRFSPIPQTLDVFGVVGYGRVVNTTNLGDDPTVGIEGDLGLQWFLYDRRVIFTVLGGGLWPGGAGARLKNEIDLTARDPIYYGQGNMEIRFNGL